MRAGMASLAAGPISPRATAAVRRTQGSSSLRAVMKAGMASLAAGPIPPGLRPPSVAPQGRRP